MLDLLPSKGVFEASCFPSSKMTSEIVSFEQYEGNVFEMASSTEDCDGDDPNGDVRSSVSESGNMLVMVRLISPDEVLIVFILTRGMAGGEPVATAGDALSLLSLHILIGLSGCFAKHFTTSRGLLGLLGDIGIFGLIFMVSFGVTGKSFELVCPPGSFVAFRAANASRQDDNLEL